MGEIAIVIAEENIQMITERFDVPREVLEARIGWILVGEENNEWWYGVLSPGTIVGRYINPQVNKEDFSHVTRKVYDNVR